MISEFYDKIKTLIFYFVLLLLINSCSSNRSLGQKENKSNSEIIVLDIHQDSPSNAKYLGKVKFGYLNFYLECSYNEFIEHSKEKARKIGGNIIKITKNKPTNFLNKTCNRISANIYYDEDQVEPAFSIKDSVHLKPQCSRIHFYRFSGSEFFKYNLYLNDSLVNRVKSNFKTSFLIKKEGKYSVRVGEGKDEMKIDLKVVCGEDYFIKCGVKLIFLKEIPTIQLIEGDKEYNSFIAKHNYN